MTPAALPLTALAADRGPAPDLSIIIVNWNAGAVLGPCLDSIRAAAAGLSAETWVVDNASTDGSAGLVRERYPWVRLLANDDNRGYAAANNQAASRARGRFLLLLNPDTLLPPTALRALLDHASREPGIGVLGPGLVHADGRRQRSAWRGYPGLAMALADALYLWKIPSLPFARASEVNPRRLDVPVEVDHLLGAVMLIRREAWTEAGPLDERFFLFLEETDWCLRARRAGWRIVYDPRIRVTHLGEHSVYQAPARNLPQLYRSWCQYFRKHHGAGPRLAALKAIIAVAAVVRVGLWETRRWRRQGEARASALAFRRAYGRVLGELPGY
jgi:GT2 family glycosyltransferase